MEIIIGIFIGVVIGVVLKTVINRVSSIGSFYIYEGDHDEKPYMFLALSANLERFVKNKFVVLKIEQKDKPPQE